ncbi:hypothetical protein L1049_025765 [Liquidambar formosana]|uniref:Uncharacterized protein n=1 Tax=Liquidambar formosana TaxID=63359 RepID=A0AAP0NF57_LIQFO
MQVSSRVSEVLRVPGKRFHWEYMDGDREAGMVGKRHWVLALGGPILSQIFLTSESTIHHKCNETAPNAHDNPIQTKSYMQHHKRYHTSIILQLYKRIQLE